MVGRSGNGGGVRVVGAGVVVHVSGVGWYGVLLLLLLLYLRASVVVPLNVRY